MNCEVSSPLQYTLKHQGWLCSPQRSYTTSQRKEIKILSILRTTYYKPRVFSKPEGAEFTIVIREIIQFKLFLKIPCKPHPF